jgi:hypothetical protein
MGIQNLAPSKDWPELVVPAVEKKRKFPSYNNKRREKIKR